MPELKSYVCPNCGASTTDYVNCEYCGSLLVRFVEKGIDLSQTTYTSDVATFPGLIEELKNNLRLQEEIPDGDIETNIWICEGEHLLGVIKRSNKAIWGDETPININDSKDGLIINFSFATNTQPSDDSVYFMRERNRHAIFKQLRSFELFTEHIYSEVNYTGKELLVTEYAIDFGKDAEGAARLISEIGTKVYGLSVCEPLEYTTRDNNDTDEEAIEEALQQILQQRNQGNSTDNSSNEGCLGGIVAILGVCMGALGSVIAAIVSLIN